MDSRTRWTSERFGDLELQIQTLSDLDLALEDLCADLERKGLARDPASFDLCPYFGVVWPSARALALHLVGDRAGVAGRQVLEVGCGLAVPSMVAALLGATVTANDFHPDVPRFLAANLQRNGADLAYVPFDWRHSPLPLGRFDLVLGSDLLYDASHARPLARALATHCAAEGRILLADPGRPHLYPCLDLLSAAGFRQEVDVHRVAGTVELGGGAAETTAEVLVVELRRGSLG